MSSSSSTIVSVSLFWMTGMLKIVDKHQISYLRSNKKLWVQCVCMYFSNNVGNLLSLVLKSIFGKSQELQSACIELHVLFDSFPKFPNFSLCNFPMVKYFFSLHTLLSSYKSSYISLYFTLHLSKLLSLKQSIMIY